MKVGLFIGNIAPTDGGGYTFVSDLLRALQHARDGCAHELVICHHANGEKFARMFPAFPALNLDAGKPSVLTVREKLFGLFPEALNRIYHAVFRVPVPPRWDERVYKRHGIQFLIRLVPWNSMTLDVPFAAIHWDLQHRNNPWFPEVSNLGEWTGREINYTNLLRRASIIFTGTEQGKKEIETYYHVPPERIKVLPLPTPAFALEAANTVPDPAVLQKLGVSGDYLFYPAQFWPHKNHVTILEACKIVRNRTGWDLGTVFAGSDKGNCDYVKDYAKRLGLDKSVKVIGFVEQSELAQLYKNAFCLTYATFCGPDNLPPLEAFALGCPVVASDVPGAGEQLGDAALLFPPHDAQILAEHIIALRDIPVRNRLLAAGFVRAKQHTCSDYGRGILASLDEFAPVRRTWA